MCKTSLFGAVCSHQTTLLFYFKRPSRWGGGGWATQPGEGPWGVRAPQIGLPEDIFQKAFGTSRGNTHPVLVSEEACTKNLFRCFSFLFIFFKLPKVRRLGKCGRVGPAVKLTGAGSVGLWGRGGAVGRLCKSTRSVDFLVPKDAEILLAFNEKSLELAFFLGSCPGGGGYQDLSVDL